MAATLPAIDALDSSKAYSVLLYGGTNLRIVSIAGHDKLTVDFDYKVALPGSGKAFTLTDFVKKSTLQWRLSL